MGENDGLSPSKFWLSRLVCTDYVKIGEEKRGRRIERGVRKLRKHDPLY